VVVDGVGQGVVLIPIVRFADNIESRIGHAILIRGWNKFRESML
jgi:hypothetical protein